jgi:hypothetical protein|tara:strand:+ start:437 stop:595 length:159 start_codon:yes stop_codon:yes gene_type:complete
MPEDIIEEDLLRSIDEVDAQIKIFRQRVQAVLDAAQGDGNQSSPKLDAVGAG